MQSAASARIGTLVFALFVCAHGSLRSQVVSSAEHSKNAVSPVPFVGCASDGQGGPLKAPVSQGKTVAIPTESAQRLAYYKAKEGPGVLAPRGWHCFRSYGSNGEALYVSPDPIRAADLLSPTWKGFAGPAIQISVEEGDTSGRFAVARTIARVFPAHKDFVENVIAEEIEPASSFPYGAYSGDTLTYQTNELVEFETAGGKEGLGTASRLQKNDNAISGVAILFGEEPNLLQLSVRLPVETTDLSHVIIQQTELEANHLHP